MTDESTLVRKLLRQQAAVANFGTFALREHDLSRVLDEAARACAEGIGVDFAKVCRYRPEENNLIIEAGYGWTSGVIGVVVDANVHTPQGRAFTTNQPSICSVLMDEHDFELPRFYAQHGIISTIDVVIPGDGHPYGILEIDSSKQQDFDLHDIDFLTGFANVLSEAVATTKRIKILADTIGSMRHLVEQKKVLAEELNHRVRNSLQLINGMLSKQLHETTDESSRQGLKAIVRRVFTLAHVYEQLLTSGLARNVDFCEYLRSLCINLVEVQGASADTVKIKIECSSIMLDLDTVTSLGIIVTELVTNSFDHAFPAGVGLISIALRKQPMAKVMIMTIRDDGPGFVPALESKRHGLGLVRRLCEQIGGSATLKFDRGAVWEIAIPEYDHQPELNRTAEKAVKA